MSGQSSRGTVHRIQSLGNAKPSDLRYVNPVVTGRKDRRATSNHRARQGQMECPECGAQTGIRKAREEDRINGMKPKVDLLIANHRVGGGLYKATRGDALCKAVGTKVGEVE